MADEVAISAHGKFVYVANRDQTTLIAMLFPFTLSTQAIRPKVQLNI
jgi:6-phosphogluconolactonase (cycloisomerase 2 family)